MIGSLLVFGFVFISVLVAFALYFNRFLWLKFIALTLLFAWSSSVFFLLHNYEGWPTGADYPRSRVVSIQVIDPTQIAPGRIFVWVYHINQVNKKFYEFNPDDTPRVYEIPYAEEKGDAFKKANDLLEKGYVIYIGKQEGFGDDEGERDKPSIEAIDPQKLLPPKQ